jgi:alanine dehydrogenase
MRILTDSDLRSLLDPMSVVEAIEGAFARDYGVTMVMPPRTHVQVPGRGVLLVMPCFDSALPGLGTKLLTIFDNPAERLHAIYILMDARSGELRAVLEANYLTEIRTAATSAVATRHLARGEAKTLGVFGTGKQARSHIEVMTAVWQFDRVLVCGSRPERSREFAAALATELGLSVEPLDARTCASQSDVICTCTNSPTPILQGCWLRPGTHVNLVGAFQPDKREADSETMRRARVVVESYESAFAEAGDLLIPMSEGVIGREHVVADLHQLVSGKKRARKSAENITLFKNLGCALEDLVIAMLACERAEQSVPHDGPFSEARRQRGT